MRTRGPIHHVSAAISTTVTMDQQLGLASLVYALIDMFYDFRPFLNAQLMWENFEQLCDHT